MHKGWIIIVIASLLCRNMLYAQIWSQEDSIKLANMLSGKDSLHLNPEYQRAIQNGTFINTNPVGTMRASRSKVPFTKDFSEYIRLDKRALNELRQPLDSLSAHELMHEKIYVDNSQRINSRITDPVRKGRVEGVQPTGYDFNHWISYALSPSYRRMVKNRKRNTWKIYNDIPALRIHEKQKAYRKEHPEMVIDK